LASNVEPAEPVGSVEIGGVEDGETVVFEAERDDGFEELESVCGAGLVIFVVGKDKAEGIRGGNKAVGEVLLRPSGFSRSRNTEEDENADVGKWEVGSGKWGVGRHISL
jgi:hypothetical protein